MIHIIVDNAAELGFLEAQFEKSVDIVKSMFKNKHGKLQASYELKPDNKKMINDGITLLKVGDQFKLK